MYEGIFDDFNRIKQHCERNGNIKFEESAVFELLESFYPQYGSLQSIQTIIDMLDAQRIRDSKSTIHKNLVELLNSDASNSNDSIIEVAVATKIHPVIDLTECSPQSDVNVDHKPINQNVSSTIESDRGSDEENGSYVANGVIIDDDISKYFDDEFDKSQTPRNTVVIADEPPLIDYFNLISNNFKSNSNQSEREQINPGLADNSEILEENNNDPNNNFDEEPLEINNVTDNNSLSRLHDFENSNSNDVMKKVNDPIPGCSKQSELSKANGIKSKEDQYFFAFSSSPTPGCSKDFDDSFDLDDGSILTDKSIEEDSVCIREIVPWAQEGEVNYLLSKFSNSPNRKQLTLDSLMNEESIKFISPTYKRKIAKDLCNIPKKTAKLDFTESFEDSLLDLLPNDSSNDSPSSPVSESMYFSTSNNEFANTSKKIENTLNQNTSLTETKIDNQKLYAYKINPLENKTGEKKRNETIVSGLLHQNFDLLKNNHENGGLSFNNGSSKEVESVIKIKNQVKEECNTLEENNSIKYRKKAIESEANLILQSNTRKEAVTSTKNNVIKPAKLLVSPTSHHQHVLKNTSNIPYIRPALLKYTSEDSMVNPIVFYQEEQDIQNRFRVTSTTRTREHQTIPLVKCPSPLPLPKIMIKNGKVNVIKVKHESDVFNPIPVQPTKFSPIPFIPPNGIHTNLVKQPQSLKSVAQPSTSKEKPGLLSNSSEVPDRNIYTKLRSIFPDVKKSYVKKICIETPLKINANEKTSILNHLIDYLLVEGHNHQRSIVETHIIDQQEVEALSVDEQYEYLLGIFPDADPTFLREFVEKNINNKQVIEQFIQEKLERRDYPTKEQYLAKIKITEQQKQYTTEFKVEKFLEIFPDPFKHFENDKRKCTYNPIAMEFLKSFFSKNKINTISRQYTLNNYNISLTARTLFTMGSDMKSKRNSLEMPSEDIPLLQEIAFVRNKKSIQNHVNTIKAQEEQLFQELKEKNLLITCQCCYNDECMPSKCSECHEGHVFCYECIIRGTESTLADGEAHVRCFTECTSDFPLATLQKILSPTTFSALLQKRQAAEVQAAGFEGLVSCPFCHFASIPPPEDKVFKCLNPECMKETCRQCKELNHVPLKCDEVVKTDKARRIIEEKMTEALIRTCYKCKRQFYKEEGCNKMTCPCGAMSCYVCDKPVNGYKHFNPQGGDDAHLCPLWSDDRFLNAQAVRKVAEDVTKALLKNNPNLKIDTESLLPKLPSKTRGPHDDIPNANQLPEHVRRLAGAAP